MGTGSSVGCCGLSALQFCSRALQSERRAEIAIFHTGGPALRTDQPTATLCLHSWSDTTTVALHTLAKQWTSLVQLESLLGML